MEKNENRENPPKNTKNIWGKNKDLKHQKNTLKVSPKNKLISRKPEKNQKTEKQQGKNKNRENISKKQGGKKHTKINK